MSLMDGKKGIIMGVANERSIAWGIAETIAKQGAKLAFTYQNEGFKKRLIPLMESINADKCYECDVSKNFNEPNSIEKVFGEITKIWDNIDFVVHALAYSDKEELKAGKASSALAAAFIINTNGVIFIPESFFASIAFCSLRKASSSVMSALSH